ncbi:MAG: TIGR04282 family arsenosugar biosynthesis glycosyltransferase [Vicinamibacterales bacterium]
MTRPVVAVMARAPSAPGKSRLLASLGLAETRPEGRGASQPTASSSPGRAEIGDAAVRLRAALLRDTLERLTGVDAAAAMLFTPASAEAELRTLAGGAIAMYPQRGRDLGARMRAGLVDLLGAGFDGVVLVGSDLPTLPRAYLRQAMASLTASPETIVLGPAEDGGYYLLGARQVHAAIFDGIAWGTARVLEQTLRAAAAIDVPVARLPPWTDVDSAADLGHVCATAAVSTERARHTCAWLASAPPAVRRRVTRARREDVTSRPPADRLRAGPTGRRGP